MTAPNAAEARISICIPVYKPEPVFLQELLESIAEQTRPVDEIVVRDDASGVDIERILDPFASSLPLKVLTNDTNLGMVGNWNAAVEASRGNLVMVVGQDDLLHPEMVAEQVAAFAEPAITASASGRSFIDEDGAPLSPPLYVNDRSKIFRKRPYYEFDGRELARLCVRNGNVFGEPSAVMFRRSAFDHVGGYDAAFGHAADLDFNLRVALLGRVRYIRRPLLLRRKHGGNLTLENIENGKVARDRIQIFERFAVEGIMEKASIERGRADMFYKFLYDALRATRAGAFRIAAERLRTGLPYGRTPAHRHLERVGEIVTGRNADAR